MSPNKSQEYRHQVDRSEETDTQYKTQDASDGEVPVGKRTEVDDRVAGAQCAPEKPGHAGQAEKQQTRHPTRSPSALRRIPSSRVRKPVRAIAITSAMR